MRWYFSSIRGTQSAAAHELPSCTVHGVTSLKPHSQIEAEVFKESTRTNTKLSESCRKFSLGKTNEDMKIVIVIEQQESYNGNFKTESSRNKLQYL
eukprot:2248106-Amphidinium_carterae.1